MMVFVSSFWSFNEETSQHIKNMTVPWVSAFKSILNVLFVTLVYQPALRERSWKSCALSEGRSSHTTYHCDSLGISRTRNFEDCTHYTRARSIECLGDAVAALRNTNCSNYFSIGHFDVQLSLYMSFQSPSVPNPSHSLEVIETKKIFISQFSSSFPVTI